MKKFMITRDRIETFVISAGLLVMVGFPIFATFFWLVTGRDI